MEVVKNTYLKIKNFKLNLSKEEKIIILLVIIAFKTGLLTLSI